MKYWIMKTWYVYFLTKFYKTDICTLWLTPSLHWPNRIYRRNNSEIHHFTTIFCGRVFNYDDYYYYGNRKYSNNKEINAIILISCFTHFSSKDSKLGPTISKQYLYVIYVIITKPKLFLSKCLCNKPKPLKINLEDDTDFF